MDTKYAYAIKSWRENWEDLTVFIDFPMEIRQIIYTINLIENLNGKIRKYTKKNYPSLLTKLSLNRKLPVAGIFGKIM